MWDEIKKSINSTLYERITSPFYGTLIISWSIWNWKIIYLTIFVSEDKIPIDKINYIVANYSNFWSLVGFPLLSTIILLTGMQYVSNWAYYLSLYFLNLKKNKKRQYESKELLTIEQSIELRTSLHEFQTKYEKMLESKDADIKNLNLSIENILNDKKNELLKKDDEIKKLISEKESITNELNNNRLQYNESQVNFENEIVNLNTIIESLSDDGKKSFIINKNTIPTILEYFKIKITPDEIEILDSVFKEKYNFLKNSIFKNLVEIRNNKIGLNEKNKNNYALLFKYKFIELDNIFSITQLGEAFMILFNLFELNTNSYALAD